VFDAGGVGWGWGWGWGGWSLPARGPCDGVVARNFFPRPQYSVLFGDVKKYYT